MYFTVLLEHFGGYEGGVGGWSGGLLIGSLNVVFRFVY